MFRQYLPLLFKPIDIASIVIFRILFGLLTFFEVSSYLFSGFITQVWIAPDLLFKYYGFYWIRPLPETYMYLLVAIISIAALFIMVGFLYRLSTVVFFLGFSYFFLLEQALYLNHYYLVVLISFLLIFIPANRSFSLDSKIWPELKSNTIPSWCLWILLFQISIVYFYSGIAKINHDWLSGEPIRFWLNYGENFLVFKKNIYNEFLVYLISYGGLLFDLLIVPLLLIRRTRIYAFTLALAFHLSNKLLFNIGIFPFFAIGLTTLYLSPSWPRKFFNSKFIKENSNNFSFKSKNPTFYILTLFIIFQLIMPLRHFLYPGNVAWTEEGHKYSWRMKLRDKNGKISYEIKDPNSGNSWKLDPEIYLNERQLRKLSTRPNLMIQFAHFAEEQFRKKGFEDVEVRASARVSLNGRKKQLIIDPNVDLSKEKESIWPAKWILPLNKPLKPTK